MQCCGGLLLRASERSQGFNTGHLRSPRNAAQKVESFGQTRLGIERQGNTERLMKNTAYISKET